MATQATRTLRILSLDFDAPLYDNSEFSSAVRQLAVNNARTPVRVLLRDTESPVRRGHRLVELSRLLTSRFQIRCVPEELEPSFAAYLIADETGYVFRPAPEFYEGTADFSAPARARYLSRGFDQAWERSSVPLNLLAFGRGL